MPSYTYRLHFAVKVVLVPAQMGLEEAVAATEGSGLMVMDHTITTGASVPQSVYGVR
jgi:hypothetical protein